jgi:hypothetical protein
VRTFPATSPSVRPDSDATAIIITRADSVPSTFAYSAPASLNSSKVVATWARVAGFAHPSINSHNVLSPNQATSAIATAFLVSR